jgi:hypothetical protein
MRPPYFWTEWLRKGNRDWVNLPLLSYPYVELRIGCDSETIHSSRSSTEISTNSQFPWIEDPCE